jgi:hypothetical protein
MTNSQLILTDATLRVAFAVLPYGRLAAELVRARDPERGAHLATAEVRELGRVLDMAAQDPQLLITSAALREATAQLRQAMIRLDLNGLELAGRRTVSVFVWDVWRDGPEPVLTCCVEIARVRMHP